MVFPLLNLLITLQTQSASSITDLSPRVVCLWEWWPHCHGRWGLRGSRRRHFAWWHQLSLGSLGPGKSWFAPLAQLLLIQQSINPSVNSLFTFIFNPWLSVKYTTLMKKKMFYLMWMLELSWLIFVSVYSICLIHDTEKPINLKQCRFELEDLLRRGLTVTP